MIDEYLCRETDRISPEGPVPVVDVKKADLRLRGAGHVISNFSSLGAQARTPVRRVTMRRAAVPGVA